MQPLVYDVIPQGAAWYFRHGSSVSMSYQSRSAALHAAETDALQTGRTVHIRVFRIDGVIDEERIFTPASDKYLNDDPTFHLHRFHSNDP
jgi:hypothetical protein